MPNFQIPPFTHLTYSDDQGSNLGYYATNQIPHFAHLAYLVRLEETGNL